MLKINKMKTIVNILFFLVVINSYSQEYMEKIAEGTCECITKKKIDLKKDEQLKLSLGLCMMESYSKYEHLVPKKERLDLSNSSQMRTFGEKLGMKMISYCPDFILALGRSELKKDQAAEINEDESSDESPISIEEDSFVEGNFYSVSKENYLYLTLKESSGKSHQLYLINNFENSFLITDNVLKPNDKIKVNYFETELYDVKLNKFLRTKVITDIQKL